MNTKIKQTDMSGTAEANQTIVEKLTKIKDINAKIEILGRGIDDLEGISKTTANAENCHLIMDNPMVSGHRFMLPGDVLQKAIETAVQRLTHDRESMFREAEELMKTPR